MTELIPFNAQAAEELNVRFGGTMFRSTEDFINFYNSGLINKNAEEVAAFAAEVEGAFKNVKLQSKNLVFISKTEVELDETLTELRKWEIIVKVQDRARALVAAGDLKEGDVLEFDGGQLFAVRSAGDVEELERVADEKFHRPADEAVLAEVHAERSSVEDSGDRLRFRASDFIGLDSSFVSDIYRVVIGR